jgi:hypothetical protein
MDDVQKPRENHMTSHQDYTEAFLKGLFCLQCSNTKTYITFG